MAKEPTPQTGAEAVPAVAFPVLDVVEHNGVRYAPDTDKSSIPSSEISLEQIQALIAAGVVSAPQNAA